MQIRCNVFETEGQGVNLANGGLNLLSSGPQPTAPEDPPNCLMPEDITMIHFPFTVVGNTFNILNQLSINPYNNNVPHIIGNNLINNVSSTAPGSSIYTTSLVGEDTCAGKWNNTLCNGKPIVAEHDYLWGNQTLSSNAPYTNKTIIVGGVLQIDADITFTNCTFLMAPYASIDIINGHTLTLNECTLMAACDELWEGIIADAPSEQLIIENGCTLRDMNEGVQIRNGAKIQATESSFVDNMTSMQIVHAPPGYVTSTNGNQGLVEGNIFSSTGAGVLYSQSNVSQGQYGLKLIGCAEVRIGAPPANGQGNRFSRVATGIFIQPDAQYPTAQYDLRNNQFSDIRQHPLSSPDVSAILQNTYSTPSGSAIYIRRIQDTVLPINWWTSTTPMVNIQGQNGVSAFARCDKAVVGIGSGVALTNYLINDCVAGLMVADAHYQNFNILNNTMNKVMAGVQLLGNLHYASIKANNISLSELNAPINLGNNPIPDPRGVDIQFWTNIHNGQCIIEGNTMTIPGIRGMGISLTKNGAQVAVAGNTVHFTTTNQTGYNPALFTSPQLHGIYSHLGDGNRLRCNTINGHQNQLVFNSRLSTGVTLSRTLNHEVHCNQMNNTRFGAQVRGNCTTDSLLFKANIFTNHVNGLVTLPGVFSDEGDLGHVGDANQDNNNLFNGTYFNPQNEATYRLWSNPAGISPRKIYTAQTFNNGTNEPQDPYAPFALQQISVSPQTCQGTSGCGSQWEQIAPPNLDQGWALEVAEDSMLYFFFPELSEWVAKYKLYSDLERDSTLMAANAILASFYQTQQNQSLGLLRSVEQKIRLLCDSTSRNDSILFVSRLTDAKTTNNSISGTEGYVQNEKWINEILLKVVEFGRDSLTTEEIEEVNTLAHSCPSVNGLGVYYARFLNAYYEPLAGYDDYALCNASAKGAKGPYDFIYSFLHSTQRGIDTAIVPEIGHKNQMMVYPVPASGIVNFRLQEPFRADATLRIYDVAGRLILQQRWPSGDLHQSIPIDRIAPGLYTWSLSEPSVCLAGKLIIERK